MYTVVHLDRFPSDRSKATCICALIDVVRLQKKRYASRLMFHKSMYIDISIV